MLSNYTTLTWGKRTYLKRKFSGQLSALRDEDPQMVQTKDQKSDSNLLKGFIKQLNHQTVARL